MNMIADYQNECRDSGWRIKTIPWWEGIEVTSSTPLLNRLAFLGIAIIIISILGHVKKFLPQGSLFAAPFGVILFLFASFMHNWDFYRRWNSVEAEVIDFEYQERELRVSQHNYKKVWCFRVICKFSINGNIFQVTPDVFESFKTEEELLEFSKKTITGSEDNKKARIYYNPKKPLQTVFFSRPDIGPMKYLGFKYPDN